MIPQRGVALLATRRPLLLGSRSAPLGAGLPASLASRRSRHPLNHHRTTAHAWQSTTATETQPVSEVSSAGTDQSGHIAVDSNESILFFDNIFPLKLSSVLTWPWKDEGDVSDLLRRFESSSLGILDPIRLVKTAIPEGLPIKVTEILPRLKDGGAYVKFRHDANLNPRDIEEKLSQHLREHPLKPWFSLFRGVHARLVQGTPWLEDLHRYPTNLLKAQFVSADGTSTPQDLPEETLYTLFRQYGKIADILPQPTDSKEVPRYALLGFPLTRDAIMARNCMHGFLVTEALSGGPSGTRLRLSYEKRVRPHSIWNWLTSHPRIVIPALAALIAGLSVVIFDPIREFFIKLHIQHSLDWKDTRVYKWFKKHTDNFALGDNRRHGGTGLDTVWNHRRDVIDQVHGWLDETSDTFIVVTGPRGSGKVEMVMDQSLEGRKNVLKVDCRPIVEARGEAGTIKRLAMAVGYRPVFSWANSMSSLIDLAVQSTTGVKAGFSETLETQLNKILQTTSSALRQVAVSERNKKDSDANISDDSYLEAHPEHRPVVVIDNFLHKGEENSVVYDKIAEWAASLVQNNVAHVVFLTTDSAYSKPLAKALPDRIFRTVSLGDLAPPVARNFVLSRLKAQAADRKEKKADGSEGEKDEKPIWQPNTAELDNSIKSLGGRLVDLEFFARRLGAGLSPREAVEEIVDETATDIVRIFLLDKPSDGDKKTWNTQQAWELIKSLTKSPSLRYNQVVLSGPFASCSAAEAEAALDALASAELISIKSHRGRPQTIMAGKPVHEAAFGVLVRDRVLHAKMELDIIGDLSKTETRSIDKVENELALLGSLPRQTGETAGRISYLLAKLEASQTKIANWDVESKNLKKILSEEF